MLKINFFRERDYIERIGKGDETVLGEIFIRYENMICSYIKTHGGASADAEDMLQESIIVLWQKVSSGKFTLTSKLGTYLLAVAKNKWRAELRKRKIYTGSLQAADTSDGNPNSLEVILSDEELRTIRGAMKELEEICRRILRMFYFEEQSMEIIAEKLNLANANVAKSKKYQCKKRLQELLGDKFVLSHGRNA